MGAVSQVATKPYPYTHKYLLQEPSQAKPYPCPYTHSYLCPLQESSEVDPNSLRVELETALLAADYDMIKARSKLASRST